MHILTLLACFWLLSFSILGETPQQQAPEVPATDPGIQAAITEHNLVQSLGADYQQLIPFSFERRALIDIINTLEAEKGANIILPQRPQELTILKSQTITYTPDTPRVTLQEAWRLLELFLDTIGFSIIATKPNLYTVVRNAAQPNEPSVTRQPLPLFVNTRPEKLPLGEEPIRYIYYLRNLRVPNAQEAPQDPLTSIFREMLSPTALMGPGNIPVIYEPKSNGFIIVDKANNIASAMHIISELDATGFKEVIEVLPLFNAPAQDVRAVFENLRKAAGEADRSSPFIRQDPRAEAISYFAADTRIVANPRTNELILMGRETAVARISEFVQQYMDTPPESGESILNYYDLQYLSAENFAPVLQNIVTAQTPTQATQQASAGGAERFFQGVQVVAEQRVALRGPETAVQEIQLENLGNVEVKGIGKDTIFTGGNRLIIAALRDDWLRIRDLIQQLDKPQPQVILEVLIVDFVLDDIRILGSTSRNPTNLALPGSVEFLTSQLTPVGNVLNITPTTAIPPIPPNAPPLAQDLLQNTGPTGFINALFNPAQGGSTENIGSLLISINDPATPGIAAIIQVLQRENSARIVSHPFLITTNNQKATIANQTIRRAQGQVSAIGAGGVQVNVEDVPATLQVQMWPHISALDRLGLQIAVDVNAFPEPPPSLRRITRRVNTNANIASGQILVIGGLTNFVQTDNTSKTPFLGDIPLIGWLFRRNRKEIIRSNLAIFIAPTVVQPKLRGGLNVYTADKIRKGRRDISDSLIFDSLQDPITRLFFYDDAPKNTLVREYLEQASNAPEFEAIKTTREKRIEQRRRPIREIRMRRSRPRSNQVTEILG